jgi:hypothetical protein
MGSIGKTVSIGNKNITADSNFVSNYLKGFDEFKDEYHQVRTAVGYLSSVAGNRDYANAVNSLVTPFNNPAEIMRQKLVDFQTAQSNPVGAADGTTPKPVSSSSLGDDVKAKIRDAHQMVQAKAASIFGDNALQKSEADEYTSMLDNLGQLLSNNIPAFRTSSAPENTAWTDYRKHYGSIKRFGDMALNMNEVNANVAQIIQERVLRAQLNKIIEPKYLSTGGQALVNYQPRGTDTVPAMLTRGEFVINKQATSRNLPLLKAINNGSAKAVQPMGGVSYAKSGGVINPIYRARGGQGIMGMAQTMGKALGFDTSSISSVFDQFISSFNTETRNFGSLINDLARVFPALGGPVSAFGGHVGKLVKALNDIKSIEIKGPNIPDTININSDTIRVELISPQDSNYRLTDEDRRKITDSLETRLKTLTTLGR